MISIVLVHIGDVLPTYLKDCIYQIKKFFKGDIYVIAEKDPGSAYNVNYVNSRDLNSTHQDIFKQIDFLKDYGLNNFWSYTLERFFVIEAFMKSHNINSIVHMENDILLYHDPDELSLHKYFKDKVVVNPLGNAYCTASYMYIDSYDAIYSLNEDLVSLLRQGKQSLLTQLPGEQMVNEMHLLSLLIKKGGVSYLPINVEGIYSDNFKDFNMIFDPASWGQYIGGTPGGGHKPGSLFKHHWIGSHMKNKKFTIEWVADDQGRRIPYLNYQDNTYKFGTLHIHCKDLIKFM